MDRLRAIVDAGVALASELSLDAVLQKIVEAAAELTGARYAALGVIDPSGQSLERFIVTGIDAETQAAIGDLPRGRGILGALIQDAKPLRLDDLAQDPRSVGFPANHPPMRTFLGVPILLRGVAYGNLYLTEKEGRRPVHRRGRGADDAALDPGRGRDRERPALRSGDPLAEAARVAERGLERACLRDRALPAPGPRRGPPARARPGAARPDRASRTTKAISSCARPTARARRSSPGCASSGKARRPAACSTAAGASVSTR